MPHKCGHEACSCDTQGKEYCSTHCATVTNMHEENASCECGHTACKHSGHS
jgi:hypothetical protein